MKRLIITSLLIILISPLAMAAKLPSGDEVIKRLNARDEGDTLSRSVLMELTDRRGKTRVRDTRSFRKYFGDEKRTVIFYLSPQNVKKTAFLTYDYADAEVDDDRWLYLPATRKVRRISAANRGDYFLGTDFSYEEIKNETKVSKEDYTYRAIGEETIDGHRCYIIEGAPVSKAIAKELGYGKVTLWVDAEIWMTRKAAFNDLRSKPLKTIYTKEIRQVQSIWTAHQLEVKNHKTDHQTRFMISDVDYTTEIRDDLFTERALRRGL